MFGTASYLEDVLGNRPPFPKGGIRKLAEFWGWGPKMPRRNKFKFTIYYIGKMGIRDLGFRLLIFDERKFIVEK